jgi:uridine kinase
MALKTDWLPQNDSLDRELFAHHIIKSIHSSFLKVDESIVIGICGSWGSGKTTFLTYIENAINRIYENNKGIYKIVHFNPWETVSQDDLQRSLLESIINNLKTLKWKENIKTADETIKKYLRYLNYLKFARHVHPIAKNIIDAVEQYEKKVVISSPDELKAEINSLIKSNEIKLYVIIDDLDRLEPAEVLAVFRAVKLNAAFANTVYFIAYDKQVVIESLKKHYSENAEQYLEKIVQADFAIPEIRNEQIENIFFTHLKDLLKQLSVIVDDPEIFKIWKYAGFRNYFRTIRDVKRYFNSLSLSLPNIISEVNLTDFISLEAIKVFDYKGYVLLFDTYKEIQRKGSFGNFKFDSETVKLFTNSITRSIVEALFKINPIFQHTKDSLNQKKINNPEFFERYYTLHIASTDISETMLSTFLTKGSNKINILNEALSLGKINNLLRRISDTQIGSHFKVTEDYDSFYALLHFGDNNDLKLNDSTMEHLWYAYFNLARIMKPQTEAAKRAVKEIFCRTDPYQPARAYFNYCIILFSEQNRLSAEFDKTMLEQLNISINHLKKTFLAHLKGNIENCFISIDQRNKGASFHTVVYAYGKYLPEVYIQTLEKYISSSHVLSFIVKNYLIHFGSNGTNVSFRLNLDYKKIMVPDNIFSRFFEELRKIQKGVLEEDDYLAIQYFIKHSPIDIGSK